MTELDITVNDGLRLSELYGQLADLQYKLDNIGPYIAQQKFLPTVLIVVVAVLLGFLLFLLLCEAFSRYASKEDRNFALAIMGGFALVMVAIWLVWMGYIDTYTVYNLECDVSRVQGEIDGILARYGGGGA